MTICIGIDCTHSDWKICLADDDTPLEWHSFQESATLQTYLQQICVRYPDVSIAVVTPCESKFAPFNRQAVELIKTGQACKDLLSILLSLPQQSYLLPSVKYLPTIAAYRRLMRPSLGSAATLCHIAYLLYQMRKQDATWLELTFYYLELLDNTFRLIVIKNGQVVDGVGEWKMFTEAEYGGEAGQAMNDVMKQALLEQLTRELVAMLAIHHIEDIVVLDHATQPVTSHKEMIIDYFADRYRFFHYPQTEAELPGFEAAQGAALSADGLSRPGLAAEVVQQLFAIANAEHFNNHSKH